MVSASRMLFKICSAKRNTEIINYQLSIINYQSLNKPINKPAASNIKFLEKASPIFVNYHKRICINVQNCANSIKYREIVPILYMYNYILRRDLRVFSCNKHHRLLRQHDQ